MMLRLARETQENRDPQRCPHAKEPIYLARRQLLDMSTATLRISRLSSIRRSTSCFQACTILLTLATYILHAVPQLHYVQTKSHKLSKLDLSWSRRQTD